jgi:hypothetical protein
MTWAALLLADPSPCLRVLVLREMLGRGDDDPEVQELLRLRETDPLASRLRAMQEPDGSWTRIDLNSRVDRLRATSLALARLGYLGFGPDDPTVRRGAEALFTLQRADGSWPLPESHDEPEGDRGYSIISLQTSLPLRGLAASGWATDPRAERAYEWLLGQRLSDGAWPTGIASGNLGYVAGYRKLAHSRWGCRSNTTGALICLAHHPTRRQGSEARQALDLLLGRETREQHTMGYEVARLIGVEPARGFITYYARFDPALILDLCARIGAGIEDPRVSEMAAFVQGLQGRYGLWDYATHPQASRWLTLDLLHSLSQLNKAVNWISMEPRTPFQTYARKRPRY